MKYNSRKFVEKLQEEGRVVFEAIELSRDLKITQKSALEILARWQRDQVVVSLTRGLYALIHPSEKKHGVRPLPIIDALMDYRKTPYYVGLLSAADYWGAAEQKPMNLHVVVSRQIKLRKQRDIGVSLHCVKYFVKAGITQGKTEAGLFCLSNPMLTALDVVTFERLCGGIDHVAAVVKKLVPLITVKDIRNCATNYRPLTSIQRLGFIMEKGEAPKQILNALCGVLEKITTSTVVLTPFGPRQGKRNATWNILVNHKIEEPHDF